MKTWSELQEWVETSADTHAAYIATRTENCLRAVLDLEVDALFERAWFADLDHDERLAIRAAIRWKAFAQLQERCKDSAEGWAEAYYRDLKRMFEEES